MATESSIPTSFDELIANSQLPVFVNFWAEWCGPCRTMTPSIKQLASDLKGKVTVVKVNVDDRPQIATKFGIQSIPTLILFKNGKPAWRSTGALPYEQLRREVLANL